MPPSDTIFEIHACTKGLWRTLGTFSDANIAVAEAVRLRRTLKYSGVRVTAENYQNNSGKFASRVIYRYSHHTRQPGTITPWHSPVLASANDLKDDISDEPSSDHPTMDSDHPILDDDFIQMIAVRLGFVILAAIVALWAIGAG